jgi:hypothetical protein
MLPSPAFFAPSLLSLSYLVANPHRVAFFSPACRSYAAHFALFFAASASLLVASSNSAVSTAPEGKCT